LDLSSQVELDLLAEAGIPPDQIIQMSSLNAARMLGREEEMGSLEPGKLADIVILDEDPLADIKNVRSIHAVIKSGRIHSLDEFTDCTMDKANLDASQRQELRPPVFELTSQPKLAENVARESTPFLATGGAK
jgi:adenine deaminase